MSAAAITGLALAPAAASSSSGSPAPSAAAPSAGARAADLVPLTLARAAEQIRQKKLSPVELTQAVLDRIESLNPKLGAFITVASDQALEAARAAEREIQQGKYRGPLHGIPLGLKD